MTKSLQESLVDTASGPDVLTQIPPDGPAAQNAKARIDDRPMAATITPERPDTPDAIALIAELEAYLEPLYPRERRQGYSVEELIAEGVALFLIGDDGAPAGCGGIKLIGTECGEIKRMYVRSQFRGLGFAKLMLNQLADYA